jgi:hypothetical protein
VKLFRFKKEEEEVSSYARQNDKQGQDTGVQMDSPPPGKNELPEDEEFLEENDAFDIPAFLRKK